MADEEVQGATLKLPAARDWKSLFYLLLGAGAVWMFLGLDPFGLGAATKLASERMALRLLAPSYFNERPSVTVVLIDDAYLEQKGSSWPLSYADQGRLARTLLGYRPDGLFLDILYRHPHGAGDNPDDLLRNLSARRPVRGRPTPVFLAAFAPAIVTPSDSADCISARPFLTGPAAQDTLTPESIGVIPELANSDVVGHAFIGWQRCENRYPLFIGGDRQIETPAFAMYRAHCAAREASAYSECRLYQRFTELKDNQRVESGFAPMTILWGAYPSAAQSALYEEGQCQKAGPETGQPHLAMRVGTLLRQAFRSLVGDVEQSTDADIRLPCPSVDVLRASQIPDQYSEQLRPFLENRLVMVGSYLDGLPDLYTSPVNGQVSGVVAHAMALDNLMTRDHKYISDLPKLYSKALEIVVLLGAVFAIWGLHLPDALKTRVTGIASIAIWGVLAALALSLGEGMLCLKLVAVALVMDWFKPKVAVQVAVLSIAGVMLALPLFRMGFVAFNWIDIVLSTWGTVELVKTVQRNKAKREEAEKISLLRLVRQKVWPKAVDPV